MIREIILSAVALTACFSCVSVADKVTVVDRPDVTAGRNSYYASNKAPLQPQYFIKLPAGTIKPAGWIAKQLELQKEHEERIARMLERNEGIWLSNRWVIFTVIVLGIFCLAVILWAVCK